MVAIFDESAHKAYDKLAKEEQKEDLENTLLTEKGSVGGLFSCREVKGKKKGEIIGMQAMSSASPTVAGALYEKGERNGIYIGYAKRDGQEDPELEQG